MAHLLSRVSIVSSINVYWIYIKPKKRGYSILGYRRPLAYHSLHLSFSPRRGVLLIASVMMTSQSPALELGSGDL